MLPEGFEWRPYVGQEPALFFSGEMIAYVTHTQGGIWRIGFLAKGTPHYKFLHSGEAAQRFVEAWACKWESGIRARPVSSSFAHLTMHPDPAQTAAADTADYARRRRRKRGTQKAPPA